LDNGGSKMTCPKECENEQKHLKSEIDDLKSATFSENGLVRTTAKYTSENFACLQKKMGRKEAIGYTLSIFSIIVAAIVAISVSNYNARAEEKEKTNKNITKIEVIQTQLKHITDNQDKISKNQDQFREVQQQVLRTLINVSDAVKNLDDKIKNRNNINP
jgi:hypothetical protein